jgi:hypothetical protein
MSSSVLSVNNVLTNYSLKVANFTRFVWISCLQYKNLNLIIKYWKHCAGFFRMIHSTSIQTSKIHLELQNIVMMSWLFIKHLVNIFKFYHSQKESNFSSESHLILAPRFVIHLYYFSLLNEIQAIIVINYWR